MADEVPAAKAVPAVRTSPAVLALPAAPVAAGAASAKMQPDAVGVPLQATAAPKAAPPPTVLTAAVEAHKGTVRCIQIELGCVHTASYSGVNGLPGIGTMWYAVL